MRDRRKSPDCGGGGGDPNGIQQLQQSISIRLNKPVHGANLSRLSRGDMQWLGSLTMNNGCRVILFRSSSELVPSLTSDMSSLVAEIHYRLIFDLHMQVRRPCGQGRR